MPGNADMGKREEFLRTYEAQVLDDLVLPPPLEQQYSLQSCLKDGERQVYLLRHHAGKPAVLKTQLTEEETSLRQEYDLLHRLRHPQLPRPLAYLEWEGREYLVRDYVEGISLAEQVEAQGPLTPSQVREISLSLCQVLNYLHRQNPPVICRDVKPQNVILDPSGRCHVIDLGAARRYRAEQREDTVLLGTRATAAPEQFGYQQISDLSPLAQLPIEYLSLTGNEVSDLGPLTGLTELQVLDLGQNPVRATEVLAELPALREVTLEATGITSVEVFRWSELQSLNVRTTWVTDYTPLEECPNLTRLITGSMPEGAAKTLAGLTGLEELRLYSTPQMDLSLFQRLQRLQKVDFFGSKISHPEALADLPALGYVNLGETGVEELSFAPTMPALTELDLRENFLTDLTPLLECPWLTRLVLSPRHQELAREQLAQAPFEVIYQP